MKRKRTLVYVEDNRDVVNIHELVDGKIIISIHDKITGITSYPDDEDFIDCARRVLDTHADTKIHK
jgi:hypothetical protein